VKIFATAIRCFFSIDRKAKPITSDIITRLYLGMIYDATYFAVRHENEPYFNVFAKWISKYSSVSACINTVFSQPQPPETLTARELQSIKNHFINRLTAEICTGLKESVYQLQPYTPTKAEQRKIQAEKWKEYGITPPTKKRQRTAAQALKDYKAYCEQLQKLTKDL